MSNINEFNRACTTVETAFNVCNSIPIVSVVTSPLRAVAGLIQLIAGGITCLGASIAKAIEQNRKNPNQQVLTNARKFQVYGSQHAIHGALNTLRGVGETMISLPLWGLFSAFLLIPNLSKDPAFSPYHGYKIHNPALLQRQPSNAV